MHRYYDDILSQFPGDPEWWMDEGFPRFCPFEWKSLGVYVKIAVLFEIACQSCHKRFKIGREWTDFDLLHRQVKNDKGEDIWVPIRQAHYIPKDGEPVYKTFTLEELIPNGLGYGDPPAHGCVGDTMGCIEVKVLQALSKNPDWKDFDNVMVSNPQYEGISLLQDWAVGIDLEVDIDT